MFYLRYDDIEGLFREAAENYQINPEEAFDWNKINRSVHEQPNEEKKPEPKKNKKGGFILWFLCFLSIGLLSYNIWSIESEKKLLQQNISSVNKSKLNNEKDNTNLSAKNEGNNIEKKQSSDNSSVSEKIKDKIEDNARTTSSDLLGSFTKKNDEYISDNIKQNKETNADLNPSPVFKRNNLL